MLKITEPIKQGGKNGQELKTVVICQINTYSLIIYVLCILGRIKIKTVSAYANSWREHVFMKHKTNIFQFYISKKLNSFTSNFFTLMNMIKH